MTRTLYFNMPNFANNFLNQNPIRPAVALYIHWPFCKSKCPYCDFNSHVTGQINVDQWLAAYLKQIDSFADFLSNKCINTIYFGGGTPSLAPVSVISEILQHLYDSYDVQENAEITLEANPTSVEIGKFQILKAAGINRVSVGIQSLRAKYLKFLGRNHSKSESLKALDAARKHFDNTSFDLIYCLPNQPLVEWMEDLEYASKILDKHISLYQLTIEKGTKFYKEYYKNKSFEMPEENVAAEFYDETLKFLADQNIKRYEISNYARPGFESQHNLMYWNYGQYLGIGPGAHSRILVHNKWLNVVMQYNPQKWLNLVLNDGLAYKNKQVIAPDQAREEKVMMGLRTIYGVSQNLLDINKIQPLIESEHLVMKKGRVIATDLGFKVLNEIIRLIV